MSEILEKPVLTAAIAFCPLGQFPPGVPYGITQVGWLSCPTDTLKDLENRDEYTDDVGRGGIP